MKCFYNFTNKEMRYFGRHRERYSIYLKVFNCGLSIHVYLFKSFQLWIKYTCLFIANLKLFKSYNIRRSKN